MGRIGFLGAALLLAGCADSSADHRARMAGLQQQSAARKAAALAEFQRGTVPADWRAQVDAALAQQLRDPDSRRILALTNPYGGLICGSVNARNGFGGMAGETAFYGWFGPDARLARLDVGSSGADGRPGPAIWALAECGRTG
jgi:hypothetical protein